MIKDTGDRLEKATQELKTLVVSSFISLRGANASYLSRKNTGFRQVEARVLRRQGAPGGREGTHRSNRVSLSDMWLEKHALIHTTRALLANIAP